MQALRLNEVLARVVAWHNRHPLARRINPTQVHSIGAVVLPFATDTLGAAPGAVAALGPRQTAAAARPLTVSELLDITPAAVAPPARQALPATAAAPALMGAAVDDLFAAAAAPAQTADRADAAALAAVDSATDAETASGANTDADADALAAAMADAAAQPLPDRAPGPPPDAVAAVPSPPADLATAADDDPFALAEADMAAEAAALAAAAAADLPQPAATDHAPDVDLHSGADSHTSTDNVDLLLSLTPLQAAAGTAALATPAPADEDQTQPGSADDTPAAAATAIPATTPATTASGRSWWQRLLARLRSAKPARPALQPMFSRSFIWPLRTGRVARWARRHGQLQPMAPTDWPQRRVDVEAPLRAAARQHGLTRDVHLHLLTAAIGVGDRRIRLLIGADGQILGPRAYSRGRVAAAAGVLGLAGAACGWALWPAPLAPDALALAAAAEVSAAASAASAAVATSAASAVPAAAHASAAASAPTLDHAITTAAAALESAVPASQAADPAASAAADPLAQTAHGSLASADPAASAAAHTPPTLAVWPSLKAAKRAQAPWLASAGSAPLGRIRPSLADDERLAARQQAAVLRGTPLAADNSAAATSPAAAASVPASPPVFAVVVRPRRFRQTAADDLKVLKSAVTKLSGPVPAHGELLNKDGAWHAAWWPFENEADAERARVLLAGRGLKADVVAF